MAAAVFDATPLPVMNESVSRQRSDITVLFLESGLSLKATQVSNNSIKVSLGKRTHLRFLACAGVFHPLTDGSRSGRHDDAGCRVVISGLGPLTNLLRLRPERVGVCGTSATSAARLLLVCRVGEGHRSSRQVLDAVAAHLDRWEHLSSITTRTRGQNKEREHVIINNQVTDSANETVIIDLTGSESEARSR